MYPKYEDKNEENGTLAHHDCEAGYIPSAQAGSDLVHKHQKDAGTVMFTVI